MTYLLIMTIHQMNNNIGNRESRPWVSEQLRGKFGKNARRWKGELAGYVAKHMWMKKHHGKAAKCENVMCSYPKMVDVGRKLLKKPSRYEWANISGEYKRDVSDYIQLCPSCHRKFDMGKITLNQIKNGEL